MNQQTVTINPIFPFTEYPTTSTVSQNINSIINIEQLLQNASNKLSILPSAHPEEEVQIASEHDAEPIKNIDDIIRISDYFIDKKQFRNNLIFIIGINTGLRCSDLRILRFKDFINTNSTFKSELVILEKKTKNTRKIQKNRHITINNAIRQAITLYLQNNICSLDDYLFTNQSNNSSGSKDPLCRYSIQRVLIKVVSDLDINIRAGTHSLRKTFGYQFMMKHNGDQRALQLLQKIFGHASASITLRYIGITSDEIKNAYNNLNLGLRTAQIIDSDIYEI